MTSQWPLISLNHGPYYVHTKASKTSVRPKFKFKYQSQINICDEVCDEAIKASFFVEIMVE